MIRHSLLQAYYSTAIGLLPAAVLRLPLHSYHFQKIKILYFESDILHTRFADSINSIVRTAKRSREMKKLQYLRQESKILVKERWKNRKTCLPFLKSVV